MKEKYNLGEQKITVAVDARPFAYGMTGNSRYLYEVLKILGTTKPNIQFLLLSHKPIHSIFRNLLEYKNISIVSEKSFIPGPIWLHFVLPFYAIKHKANLIWGSLQLLPLIYKFCPMIVNYHDLNFISAPQTMARWNFWQHRLLSGITIRKADSILCLSQNTKNDISAFIPEASSKCRVVYPGVSIANKKIKKTKGINSSEIKFGKFIFTLGTLEPRKNIKTLIQAYLDLKVKIPKFPLSLLIAGRAGWGLEGEELLTTLRSGALESKNVYFIENPSDTVLDELYKSCSVFAFPSLHEGFGLPLLEAMKENKNCIASDIPIFKEILSPNYDILVPPLNQMEWTNALKSFLKNPPKPRRWNSKEWTWYATATKIGEEIEICSR
ncbi:glycosyltransferase family 4 protein [Leptospira sp. GIMC2001]|uniref:glycosyltransferase family 4 protein n=1 Tax=Leptospira sp. GIMC2001 TaxID=1513297 RepID=UPI00234B030E|nr:glycosyltransferase family 1 protein [Leptospira sp. GIMC2001]WCL47634.1 glycosyltransferase family 1 protein [Leptospira sp. GIMC2001]